MAAPSVNLSLRPPINAEHEARQAASVVYKVFGATRLGIEHSTYSSSGACCISLQYFSSKTFLNDYLAVIKCFG